MMFRRVCLLLCCCALILWSPAGTEARGGDRFYFFVITDTQLGMYDQNRDLSRESENLQKLVAIANRLHPAFIVNCGDLINRPGDSREIQEYKRVMSGLDREIPLYNVPGNHDLKNQPTPESLAAYRKEFGSDYFVFRFRGFEGIVLNSSLIKYPESSPEEAAKQSAWLKSTLAKVQGKKPATVALFQHIPWFLHEVEEDDNYSNLPKSVRQEYLGQFEKAQIHNIFSGHLHDSASGTYGSTNIYTVSALGKPLGKTPSGFGVVVVDGAKLQFTYYPIDMPPTEIRI